jgi:hypothetical protein
MLGGMLAGELIQLGHHSAMQAIPVRFQHLEAIG